MTHPLSENFTIAKRISDADRIGAVAAAVGQIGDGTVTLTASDLRDVSFTDQTLSAVEIEAIFVGLLLNEAGERAGDVPSLIDDSLIVDTDRAEVILREQGVARRFLNERGEKSGEEQREESSSRTSRSRLVATVPSELGAEGPDQVDDLDARLRATILDADKTVRIAMPYFDPGHPTVEALHGLPTRGVTTHILTRRVEPGTDRYEVLEAIVDSLTPEDRNHLKVAELFVEDEHGRQAYATHAKMVVADESTCYIGSANFTVTNLMSNFEIGTITSTSDARVAARLFDEVFAASHRIAFDRFR